MAIIIMAILSSHIIVVVIVIPSHHYYWPYYPGYIYPAIMIMAIIIIMCRVYSQASLSLLCPGNMGMWCLESPLPSPAIVFASLFALTDLANACLPLCTAW